MDYFKLRQDLALLKCFNRSANLRPNDVGLGLNLFEFEDSSKTQDLF